VGREAANRVTTNSWYQRRCGAAGVTARVRVDAAGVGCAGLAPVARSQSAAVRERSTPTFLTAASSIGKVNAALSTVRFGKGKSANSSEPNAALCKQFGKECKQIG
jgi:hypothetical protein